MFLAETYKTKGITSHGVMVTYLKENGFGRVDGFVLRRPEYPCVRVQFHDDVNSLEIVGLPGGGDDGSRGHGGVTPVKLVAIIF